jgi:hypothetical protein
VAPLPDLEVTEPLLLLTDHRATAPLRILMVPLLPLLTVDQLMGSLQLQLMQEVIALHRLMVSLLLPLTVLTSLRLPVIPHRPMASPRLMGICLRTADRLM